jgi:hypothetical protein
MSNSKIFNTMKNILYLLSISIIFLGLNACEPNKDIYDELPNNDSTLLANINKIPADSEYTLSDADYELSSNESVANYKNFSANAPVADYLPEIINELFLTDPGAELQVTYNFYDSFYLGDTIPDYELDSADYTSSYYNYDNFNGLYTFLNSKYPEAEEGDLITLTYAWYFGGGVTDTVSNTFVSLGDETWTYAYKLTSSDYSAMGQTYPNFGDEDDAEFRLPIYLQSLNTDYIEYQYAQAGDVVYILYDLYSGGLSQEVLKLEKSATAWEVIGSITQQVASMTSSSAAWSFVPPIEFIETTEPHTREYTLTNADYALVGNGTYYNFDVRPGANEESIDVRISKISTILKANFADLAIGDIFLVNYNIYDGSADTWQLTLKAVEKE